MQRGWLLLGLGLLALVLSAAPALASKESEGDKIEKGLEKESKAEESSIFKGFLDLSIWTIVVFLVLFFVLKKWAWGPMLEGLQKREESIRSAMEDAKKAKEEASTLRTELLAEIAKARSEAQAVRDEARRDAERLRDEIAAKAKADMQAERERLRRDMDTARDQVLQQLWAQTAQLATMIAAKAVKRQITIEDQNRLLDEALAELPGAATERQREVASIQ